MPAVTNPDAQSPGPRPERGRGEPTSPRPQPHRRSGTRHGSASDRGVNAPPPESPSWSPSVPHTMPELLPDCPARFSFPPARVRETHFFDEPGDVRDPDAGGRNEIAVLSQVVRTALDRLTHAQREIAARQGQPLGTVKTRMRSALERLRQALRPLVDAPGEIRAPPPERVYPLWFARPGQAPLTGGAFQVSRQGKALVPVRIPAAPPTRCARLRSPGSPPRRAPAHRAALARSARPCSPLGPSEKRLER